MNREDAGWAEIKWKCFGKGGRVAAEPAAAAAPSEAAGVEVAMPEMEVDQSSASCQTGGR